MGLLVRSLLRQQTGYSGDSCGFNLLDGRSWDLRSYLVQTGGSNLCKCLLNLLFVYLNGSIFCQHLDGEAIEIT